MSTLSDDVTSTSRQSPEKLSQTEQETLRDLIYGFMSAEFATVRDGKPATFPLTPFYDPTRELVIVTSPVAYAGKVRTIEHDPRVSLLLHDADGEYLMTGNARVREDTPEGNAAYVRDLVSNEPETPKRTANEEKFDFMDSRLGSKLVGWVGQRVVVEIEPVSLVRVADPSPLEELSGWSDVGMGHAEAGQYDRAVLTVVGDDGYPVTRPVKRIQSQDDAVISQPWPGEPPSDGQPACLLLHWHDDASIYFGQRLIRGRFRTDDESSQSNAGTPQFVPGSSSTLRNDSLVDTLRFIIDGKRKTRAYFRETEKTGGGRTKTKHTDTPPGPIGRPLIGNTVQFIRDPFRFYQKLPGYGDIVRYRIGWNTWTAVLHPDDVERVLVGESHRFRRYNFEELGFDFVSEGLFFTDGEQWRRQRKVIQPAFGPRRIAPFADTIVDQTTATVDSWDDGEIIAANHEFSELVLELLATTLFDLDLDERHDVVTEAGRALAARVDTQSLSAFLPSWVPTARNRRFNRQMARFDDLVQTLLDERRNEDVVRDDLLSTLLELTESERDGPTDETGGLADETDVLPGEIGGFAEESNRQAATGAAAVDYTFTDEELRDQLVTFLFAGHETTSLVLTYASLLLAQHDEVRRTLEAEIETVCGDRPPTFEDVSELEFTEKVIRETMRYYPPVYVLFREAREDVTIDGYLIPEGTKLALPQFILHSDERWWDDPHEFRPDRWSDDLFDEVPEYAYFPFGGGPRHCVGMRLAMLILTLGLATIASRVQFDLESEPEPDLRMSATLSPASDVELKVRKR